MTEKAIFYATTSVFKREEFGVMRSFSAFASKDGPKKSVNETYNFEFSDVKTDEPLEIDLEAMVRHKVRSAYRSILMPCIVEHAGIVISQHYAEGYPGGLTQPMWDALEAPDFLRRTGASGESAVAKAVVGFCDGMHIRTFVGETKGVIATEPRGDARKFYWDTVFCPGRSAKTYAEIVETDGLKKKMLVSQSYKAMRKFAQYLAKSGGGQLFDT